MKFRLLFSLFSLTLVLATAQAQTTAERAADRATNRAENRAQSNVDRKVDGAVDDAFNAIGGLFKKKDKKKKKKRRDGGAQEEDPASETDDYSDDESIEEARTGMLQNMGLLGGKWEPYTNPTTLSLDMDIEHTKRNGKQENSTVELSILETAFAVRFREQGSDDVARMILNTQSGKVVVVNTEKGKTEAMRMSMPGLGKAIQEMDVDEADFSIERTGERRTIDGYNCEKVIVTDHESGTVSTSWVTKDIDINIMDIAATFGGMTRGKNPAAEAMAQDYPGFPIETTVVEDRESTTVRYRNIKLAGQADRSLHDTSGLEIQDIGGF